jgi:hypothetical protein
VKVTTISANLRFSKDIGHGAWKVIEIGAEASVEPREDWQSAQTALCQQLGQQMTVLWNSGNGKPTQEPPKADLPPPQSEHWCVIHQTEFKRFSKDNKVWYSHKAPDGKWCNESSKK